MTTIFLMFYLFIFRVRGREGEREEEKHQCVVASHAPPTGGLTWSTTQECTLTGNQTGNPLVHRLALNPLSHTSQGLMTTILKRAIEIKHLIGYTHIIKVKFIKSSHI